METQMESIYHLWGVSHRVAEGVIANMHKSREALQIEQEAKGINLFLQKMFLAGDVEPSYFRCEWDSVCYLDVSEFKRI